MSSLQRGPSHWLHPENSRLFCGRENQARLEEGPGSHWAGRQLTFPPVTEKLANMQYFSFLWPVYVFRH